MKSTPLLLMLTMSALTSLVAAVPRDFAIDLSAAVSDTVPHITLSWTQRAQSNITAQAIHRRLKGEATWVKLADLTNTQTSYADSTALTGVEYEYWMQRSLSLNPNTAMGYLSAGVKVPEVHSRGKLLLVIDDTMLAPLAPEIEQLKRDLAADGWTVVPITAPRTGTAISTKALIKAAYDADPINVKQVYLLGHVPVPYSGYMAPDGHGDHYGAWPADGYYGDMNGTWTDTTVNSVSATDPRNRNIPGDGKFDQNMLPALVTLQVGRVDLQRLGRSPAPIDATMETTLLRRYLNKAHSFRHKLGLYASIPRRSLIRDGFGHFTSAEPFSMTGWAGAFSNVGRPPSEPVDEAPTGQWFSAAYAGGQSYLWGYGNGAGSYESAYTMGSSTDFGHKPSRVVFTSIFGSFNGDWDSDNNLMRSILAGNPNGDSLGLCSFWAGRPSWFVHSLGMGETLGFMARLSMNAAVPGGIAYVPTGSDSGRVHLGLMGDPALRIHAVEPPRKLTGSTSSGQTTLTWAASTETNLQGYHVYRADTPDGPFTRLTGSPQAGTSYTDSTTAAGETHTYLVRTLKLESAPGGSYYNLSVGSPLTITAGGTGTPAPQNPSELSIVSQANSGSAQISWQDNSGDEAGFRIERKVNAAGVWSTLATVAADATTYTDPGPFTHGNVYFYRAVATGPAGDSIASNIASFEASAGFIEFVRKTMTATKSAGTAAVAITRFGGGTGAVTVAYSTSASTATPGTHYTETSGTLTWADGEVGEKVVSVPLTNSASPQQARQFVVYTYGAGGGARMGAYTSMAVLIEDPSAALGAPWAQTLLGSVTHASPAVEAEGFLGSTMIGGSLGGGSDTGRFVYQTRTGDGSMTAYIRNTTPFAFGSRVALMVRESLAVGSKMAGVVTGGSDYGTKLAYRTSISLVDTPGSNNTLVTPCWVRITRMGLLFIAEHSTDGSTWTSVEQVTLSSMPGTAYWGIFTCASDITPTNDSANYQLAGAQSIAFASVPAPSAPDGLLISTNSSPTSLVLRWNTKTNSAGYRIERRNEGGSFAQIADVSAGSETTQSFTNTGLATDTAYEYRVSAYNSTGATTSLGVRGVTSLPDIVITRTTDDPGGADATVRSQSPAGTFGSQETLSVACLEPNTYDFKDVSKTYLRFNLGDLPGTIKSASLKLAFLAQRLFDEAGYFFMEPFLLTSEEVDAWEESSISWNNAPLNETTGAGLHGPSESLGYYFVGNISNFPSAGEQARIGISGLTPANIGANNLVTIAITQSDAAAQTDWASREHGTFPPPALELTFANPQPLRPGFLSVTSGTLVWFDGSPNETAFEIGRRVANGDWVPLTTVASNSTSFTDASALPGVIYEYRIRATVAGGASSSWATVPSLLLDNPTMVNRPVWSPDSESFHFGDPSKKNAYVPTGLTYHSPALAFVSGQTLSAIIRNDYNGWLGMKFTVGAAPVIVRELGRWVIAGSTGVHTVKLVNAATGVAVPNASASVATSGAPAGFAYAALASPVTLAANTSYYLISQEFKNGDPWYEANSSVTYNSGIAVVNSAAYTSSGVSYTLQLGIGNCAIPVSFKYSLTTIPLVAGHGMTTLRNNFSGWLGMEMTVGDSPLRVAELGRWVVPGNTGSHQVKLVEAGTGNDIASVVVVTAGAPTGQFKYTALPSTVTLAANTAYYLLSQETAGGDQWYDFAQSAPGTATGYQSWLLSNGLPMDESGTGSASATPANDGLPNLIKYALGLAPAISGNAGRLSYGTADASGNTCLSLTYSRPEPSPVGLTYAVEASSDLASWTNTGLVQVGSTVNAGLRTITIRDSVPMSGGVKRFMRLRISQP